MRKDFVLFVVEKGENDVSFVCIDIDIYMNVYVFGGLVEGHVRTLLV